MSKRPIRQLSSSELGEWLSTAVGDRPVLLGVSGGMDSMVLWQLLHESGHAYGLAHVNYHLRDQDSNDDEALVWKIANQRGVLLDVLQNSTLKGASNIQARARAIRLDFFQQCCKARNYAATLLAHHADDQLETVLIGLARGAGPNAIAGIKAIDTEYLRPLLSFSKEEISAFAKTHDVEFREDKSNAGDGYLRNRIRHHIVPPLKNAAPDVLKNLSRTALEQQQVLEFASGQVASLRTTHQVSAVPFVLDRDELAKLPGLGYVVHELLRSRNFGAQECIDITERIQSDNRAKAKYENLDRSIVCFVAGKGVWCEAVVDFQPTNYQLTDVKTYASQVGELTISPALGETDIPTLSVRKLDDLVWRSIDAEDFKAEASNSPILTAFAKTSIRPSLKGHWLTSLYLDGKVVWLFDANKTEVLAKAEEGNSWKLSLKPTSISYGPFLP